ncbi:hypothetical protein MGYG_02367 [Nannizzia gypsea CBS 118893]|uniref:Uncharacterized protein n=1 Tax=Arthroderma gypseum (strain ATCC MYA-4604 / CBS 118893) TaxID=535722 RepID=E4UR79_ARTGP|nr:hypothetical protein MGYG_02367 [Nannizzia gypsea CBS 118893]EFQ99354.1 hypothetical protein MGYG_02367 [Nannizzia gypsea CBS 118893]
MTVPLLYRDVHLVILTSDKPSELGTRVFPWLNCLRGIAHNTQGQAACVKRIVIRGNRRYSQFYEKTSIYPEFTDVRARARQNAECFQIGDLLLAAFIKMKNLRDFCWTADCLYPTDEILELQKNLRAFTYCYPWPSDAPQKMALRNYSPDIRHLSFQHLEELSIFGIPSYLLLNTIWRFMLKIRKTLKVLRLGGINNSRGYFEPLRTWHSYRRQNWFLPKTAWSLSPDTPIQLHTLEILFFVRLNIEKLTRAFDFTALKNFSLILPDDFTPQYPTLWQHFQSMGVSLKSLKTNMYTPTSYINNYLRSFDSLEEVYALHPEYSFDSTYLHSHFSNLRILLVVSLEGDITSFCNRLQILIAGCPKLEELGIPLSIPFQESVWQALAPAQALRCLYFVEYVPASSWKSLGIPGYFILRFFSYFKNNPSPLIYRLEVLSCYRTLWRLLPLASAPMEERTLEKIRRDENDSPLMQELRDLTRVNTWPEPFCYDYTEPEPWLNRAAIRADWEDYWDDEMASSVHTHVMKIPKYS